jgi:hypothetical protein
MHGERNLETLLRTMQPQLKSGKWAFRTSPNGFDSATVDTAILMFKESEGMTIISPVSDEETHVPAWGMITLSIHSDLEAVGFLAAITTSLAAMDIPVNAVSAFFHDHIFVPYERREAAMECLRCMMRETHIG